MTIKSIAITGRWFEDVCGFMDELDETGGDWR